MLLHLLDLKQHRRDGGILFKVDERLRRVNVLGRRAVEVAEVLEVPAEERHLRVRHLSKVCIDGTAGAAAVAARRR